jgi:cysteine desulfuration protein SufE
MQVMQTPVPAIESLIDDFGFLDDWEDRYRYVIELGKSLPPLAESERTDENKVRGCASQVWLVSETAWNGGPVLHFRGDSDAHIVRGLIAILLALYSGRPAREIAATDPEVVFGRIGLREHLTSQRSNGLSSMVARIRSDAKAALAERVT